jgi:hypothetical protein
MTILAMAVSPRRPAERWADLCILVCGLLLGAAGAIALLVATFARRDTRLLIGVAIYAVGCWRCSEVRSPTTLLPDHRAMGYCAVSTTRRSSQ